MDDDGVSQKHSMTMKYNAELTNETLRVHAFLLINRIRIKNSNAREGARDALAQPARLRRKPARLCAGQGGGCPTSHPNDNVTPTDASDASGGHDSVKIAVDFITMECDWSKLLMHNVQVCIT